MNDSELLLWRLDVFLALEESVPERYIIDCVHEAYVHDVLLYVLFCSHVIV